MENYLLKGAVTELIATFDSQENLDKPVRFSDGIRD